MVITFPLTLSKSLDIFTASSICKKGDEAKWNNVILNIPEVANVVIIDIMQLNTCTIIIVANPS